MAPAELERILRRVRCKEISSASLGASKVQKSGSSGLVLLVASSDFALDANNMEANFLSNIKSISQEIVGIIWPYLACKKELWYYKIMKWCTVINQFLLPTKSP